MHLKDSMDWASYIHSMLGRMGSSSEYQVHQEKPLSRIQFTKELWKSAVHTTIPSLLFIPYAD